MYIYIYIRAQHTLVEMAMGVQRALYSWANPRQFSVFDEPVLLDQARLQSGLSCKNREFPVHLAGHGSVSCCIVSNDGYWHE